MEQSSEIEILGLIFTFCAQEKSMNTFSLNGTD